MEVRSIVNKDLESAIRKRLAGQLYPPKSLGLLRDLAIQIGLIQQSVAPVIEHPALLIFASDYGFSNKNFTSLPGLSTADLLLDFLNEGAPINVFASENNLNVKLIDVGVDHAFENTLGYWLHQGTHFFNRKINRGCKNMVEFPAMTTSETDKAIDVGREMVQAEYFRDCNTIGIGDIGVGNTTSAAALCTAITTGDPEHYIIKRDIGEIAYQEKLKVVKRALGRHPMTHDPHTLLSLFGGFEIAAMVGAILQAAESGMLIMIDGFVSSTAALVASQICPEVLEYCVFCTVSGERAHQNLLDFLEVDPLLQLNLGIGEGSGVALAFPIIKSSTAILRNISK